MRNKIRYSKWIDNKDYVFTSTSSDLVSFDEDIIAYNYIVKENAKLERYDRCIEYKKKLDTLIDQIDITDAFKLC